MPTRRRTLVGRAFFGLAALSAVVLAAGCGSSNGGGNGGAQSSDSGGTSSGQSAAAKLVKQEQAPPAWTAPGPAFDASKARGKLIWYVPVADSIPLSHLLGQIMGKAGAPLGVSVHTCDGKGSVDQFASCIQQGIGRKADAIVLQSIPTSLVKPQIEDAKKAGIPVIQSQEHDPALPTGSEKAAGVVAKVGFSFSEAGRRMAHLVAAEADKDAHVVAITSSDVPESADALNGFKEDLAKYCPGCKVDVKSTTFAKWATDIPTLTQSIVKDPTVKFIVPIYDNMATFAAPAVDAAGAGGRVKIITFNNTPSVMKLMDSGDVVVGETGNANTWAGWAFMDQALRVLVGQPPLADEKIPFRTFTSDNYKAVPSNLGSIDLGADEATWYGDVDPGAEYQKLWGSR